MDILIGDKFPKKIIPLIESSRRSIEIVVFDWRWYENDSGCAVQLFNQALVRACRRGIQIRAIINSDSITKILQSQGINARRLPLKNLVHAKLMIIDDITVILGSHNYTQNAFTKNHEISVVLTLPEKSCDFSSFFESLWQT